MNLFLYLKVKFLPFALLTETIYGLTIFLRDSARDGPRSLGSTDMDNF